MGSKNLLPGNSTLKVNFLEVQANFHKTTASACKIERNSIKSKALFGLKFDNYRVEWQEDRFLASSFCYPYVRFATYLYTCYLQKNVNFNTECT